MAILNVGSVNIDHVYRLPRMPAPGETLAAADYARGLGGKGTNMSLAAARAGAQVLHCGAVGADGAWCVEELERAGVDTDSLVTVAGATGHAVILVASGDEGAGENMIVIHPGANRLLTQDLIDDALGRLRSGWLLLQNETNLAAYAAARARDRGLRVAYAAAPFEAAAAAEMLPLCDLLAVNEVESAQLASHLWIKPEELPVAEVLVTRGARGAAWRGDGETAEVAAVQVAPVDTTGAGDTFLGVFLAGLEQGKYPEAALERAAAAAALQVTRPGAAAAIPTADEVDAFMAERGL